MAETCLDFSDLKSGPETKGEIIMKTSESNKKIRVRATIELTFLEGDVKVVGEKKAIRKHFKGLTFQLSPFIKVEILNVGDIYIDNE